MPFTISINGQSRWKNSYSSCPDCKLTLRSNGEESAVIITPQGQVVPAGFDAPDTAPTCATGAAGNVPVGYYYYRYVYASSAYPFVSNDVTGGGEQWPRSAPSDANASVLQVATSAKHVAVTLQYTTRSDVDFIWLYRTSTMSTAALALAESEAGRFYYVGRVANNTSGGSVIFDDNSAANTGELLELDNFKCPLFRFTVCDGEYYWGWGNTDFETVVSLDGTDTITIDTPGDKWFSGREGTTATLVGITTGGYDGRGSFYFIPTSTTTGQLFASSDMISPSVIPATGTTTIRISAPSTTLYRSKSRNPFSWGRTTQVISGDGGSVLPVSDIWAEKVGGGYGTAISTIPNERILKLDSQQPTKSVALDLNSAGDEGFISTLRTLDENQSCSSHFAQLPLRGQSGQVVRGGVDAKCGVFISADAQSQIPIGDKVIEKLRLMYTTASAAHFYHAFYDSRTELNCWFIKTSESDWKCDTMLYQHAPTNTWGVKYFPMLSASATIMDAVDGVEKTILADESGHIGRGLSPDTFKDWSSGSPFGIAVSAGIITTGAIPGWAINNISFSGGSNIATIITTGDNDFAEGDTIQVFGADPTIISGIYVVEEVQSATIFTCLVVTDSPSYSGSGGFVFRPPFIYPLPANDEGDSRHRVVIDKASVLSAAPISDGVIQLELDTAFAMNLDEWRYGALEDGAYGIYPCRQWAIAKRHFNSGTPERNKQLTEAWSSETGVDEIAVHEWRFYLDNYTAMDATNSTVVAVVPQQDTIGSSALASSAFFHRAIPSLPMHMTGFDISELGELAFEIQNFTLKMHEA